jgi:hypothetical protein
MENQDRNKNYICKIEIRNYTCKMEIKLDSSFLGLPVDVLFHFFLPHRLFDDLPTVKIVRRENKY